METIPISASRGALIGFFIAMFTIVTAVTDVHVALGIQKLVLYLAATPLVAIDAIAEANGGTQWAVIALWWMAIGAAAGWALGSNGGGIFFAAVLMTSVLAGHLQSLPKVERDLGGKAGTLKDAVQMLMTR